MKAMNTHFILKIAAMSLLALFSSTLSEMATARADGIAAPPRVQAQLDERNAYVNQVAAPALPTMACPLCQDQYSTSVDTFAKGVSKPTILTAKHLCAGCDTVIGTAGEGKAKHSVAVHSCTSCGAAPMACCAVNK